MYSPKVVIIVADGYALPTAQLGSGGYMLVLLYARSVEQTFSAARTADRKWIFAFIGPVDSAACVRDSACAYGADVLYT